MFLILFMELEMIFDLICTLFKFIILDIGGGVGGFI